MSKVPAAVSEFMRKIGRKGGKAGKGKRKLRRKSQKPLDVK
jgi:hypothetical protein